MKRLTALLLFSLVANAQNDLLTDYEKGNKNQSATYDQIIAYYRKLDAAFDSVEMREAGLTDSGKPLHIVTFNPSAEFDFEKIRKSKSLILINNGIHAGEPDGIDATMMFFRDLATGKIQPPKQTAIVAIPVYNIGGILNRNSTSRVNQEGPEEYGFRGNARNFDLNRDFMKADARNTRSFYEIFQMTQPQVFIDNHVSNGADYQYVLTYIMTQQNKLGPYLGKFLDGEMMPAIADKLKKRKVESVPYVNAWSDTPDKGFAQFFESPRYATGYTALFNTIGFVVETHMLKKYSERVMATYEFMRATLEYADDNRSRMIEVRIKNADVFKIGNVYPINWKIDSTKAGSISFKGYEGTQRKSAATTGNRLYYDRKKPFERKIPYYKEYRPTLEVTVPGAYVIPQGWWPVIDLLKLNQIEMRQFQNDTILEVESYRIVDYATSAMAYEGHYPHRNTKVATTVTKKAFSKGDYFIATDQPGVRYLLEALEPQATDSFFNWNFFDTILQQKEHYSDYVFEDLAAEMLRTDAALISRFEAKLQSEKSFADDPRAQLDWIYKNSKYYEKEHLQYPVYRVK